MTQLHLKVIIFNISLLILIITLFLKKDALKDKVKLRYANFFIIAAFLLLFAQYAVYIDAQYIEPNWIKIEKLDIVNNRFPKNLTIVHLSDLHIKKFGYREHSLIKKVNSINPDILLITGDFLTERKYLPTLLSVMKKIKAKKGIYGIAGDNDLHVISLDDFKTAMGSARVYILDNDNIRIPAGNGEGLWVIGLTSEQISSDLIKKAYAGVNLSEYKILLSHYPRTVDSEYINNENTDLVLSGGTHGGQIGLPFGRIFYHHKFLYQSGLYYVRGMPLYVNRGIGTVGDIHVGYAEGDTIRFFCRPEITILRFKR